MNHPRKLRIDDFTYVLPDEKIARSPLHDRSQSRLLVFKEQNIKEDHFMNIAEHLPQDALLVFNNSRVLEARILFEKPTGGVIEIFLLEPHSRYNTIQDGISQEGKVYWKCLVGGASKWKHGQVLTCEKGLDEEIITLAARINDQVGDGFIIEFTWKPSRNPFERILELFGQVPIPPYLKRGPLPMDADRYQTIYASHKGSVAAPTAGLHFTDSVFQSLTSRDIKVAFVTLHVGAGTFLPVKSEMLEGHQMHAEFMDIDADLIRQLMDHSGNILAVGTTSLRTIESVYWMGLKCSLNPEISYEDLEIGQWEVYDHLKNEQVSIRQALGALLSWMQKKSFQKLVIKTRILIAPGYPAKMIRALVTNFHQPNSTLLLLVAALIGDDWKRVYGYALENDMRFLSYGDGCLLYLA